MNIAKHRLNAAVTDPETLADLAMQTMTVPVPSVVPREVILVDPLDALLRQALLDYTAEKRGWQNERA